MRHLVACPRCRRQYDATGREAGSRFRCACGELVTVPEARPHSAAVVRCSACGAPREGDASSCSYCGSDFTLAERDLDTICPGCMARVSDRARFCHYCGTPIVPEAKVGEATDRPCPACGPERRLSSRRLGDQGVAVLECERCGGLWLGVEVFHHLEERSEQLTAGPAVPLAPVPEPALPPAPAVQEGPLYRPCAVCGRLMNRSNYGRKSGVIVDVCNAHGVWFDRGELERILAWIREGGLDRSRRLERIEQREGERRQQAERQAIEEMPLAALGEPVHGWQGSWVAGSFLLSLTSYVWEMIRDTVDRRWSGR